MTTVEKKDWHHKGSSSCTPFRTCCLSWWCPCIVYGRTRYRIENNDDMKGYSCCNHSCAGFCGLICLGISFVMLMMNRGDMRAKYHLKGNRCTDCLCACCCTPCDVAQQDKESAYREEQNKPVLAQPGKDSMIDFAPQ
ncbi:hypothetical protein EK21DRAFT_80733 [Setomelanomma holmii]|uniref:PLAC8-domain-containing protein n=1 Tax=Setomelanomma holmii TaxID=210430 RepID=A0A9P4GVK5_9PLEO|nr:hypothetical protein EK21DRAFT_80733 [Setomelanomma holmii]